MLFQLQIPGAEVMSSDAEALGASSTAPGVTADLAGSRSVEIADGNSEET